MTYKNNEESQLELELRYRYDYVEADFARIRNETLLFSYKELLEIELDSLRERERRASSNTRKLK